MLAKSRRYAVENKNSQSKEVVEKVVKEIKKVSLLQNNVIVPREVVRETSESRETLNLTDSRQYREHGLLNISDSAYQFFMLMEQQRVDLINTSRLSQLGSRMISDSLEAYTKNNDLQNAFQNLFRIDENRDRVSLDRNMLNCIRNVTYRGGGGWRE